VRRRHLYYTRQSSDHISHDRCDDDDEDDDDDARVMGIHTAGVNASSFYLSSPTYIHHRYRVMEWCSERGLSWDDLARSFAIHA